MFVGHISSHIYTTYMGLGKEIVKIQFFTSELISHYEGILGVAGALMRVLKSEEGCLAQVISVFIPSQGGMEGDAL